MMKQSANSAVRFSSYQGLKDMMLSHSGEAELSNGATMAIGGMAGIITVYTTMPFE